MDLKLLARAGRRRSVVLGGGSIISSGVLCAWHLYRSTSPASSPAPSPVHSPVHNPVNCSSITSNQSTTEASAAPPLFSVSTRSPTPVDTSIFPLDLAEPEYISLPASVQESLEQQGGGGLEEPGLPGPSPAATKQELQTFLPRHLRRPWRLLHQANTGDYEQHLRAVRELGRLVGLSDGEACQLAQAMTRRTAVGLARTLGCDPRLLPAWPPAPPHTAGQDPLLHLRDLLERLGPEPGQASKCSLTMAALELLARTEERQLEREISEGFCDESHTHLTPRPRPPHRNTLLERGLEAVLAHTPSASQTLLDSLPVLASLARETDSVRVQSLLANIVASLAEQPQHHQAIFQSGWVGQLAAWRFQPALLLSLHAERGLANLDSEWYADAVLGPGLYLLGPQDRLVRHANTRSNWGVDLVFVHGLWGGVFYTWRQGGAEPGAAQSSCWPRDWLLQDSTTREHVRILGCHFDSGLSQWGVRCPETEAGRSLEARARDLLSDLQRAGVGSRPVIFVGHSMGGLIIKQMLVQAGAGELELARNTRGVLFYSTPHRGTQIANMNSVFKYFFFPSVEVQELGLDSPALLQLNSAFKQFVEHFQTKVISFGETLCTRHLGLDLRVVPPESANPGLGEFIPVAVNHEEVCKPDTKRSVLFRKLNNLMWDCIDEASPYLQ